jgi:hypothetical protein
VSKPRITSIISTLLLSSLTSIALAGEPLAVEYKYEGNTSVSLASVMGGPLSVNSFTDSRSGVSANDISRGDGNEPLTLTNQTAAELVQSSFVSLFEAAGASLGEAGSPLVLQGNLIEMSVVEKGDGYEVQIRCELTLRNQGRNAWQSVAFSRVETDNKDASAALKAGLNRLAADLFRDDYFLMELGIF